MTENLTGAGKALGEPQPDGESSGSTQAQVESILLPSLMSDQATQVRQIIDAVPEGMLLLDADRRIVLANSMAVKILDVLAGVKPGEVLEKLGDRPISEFLSSPPEGLWHVTKLNRRVYEVIARPMDHHHVPAEGGWVLVLRDVTQERDIQRRIQQQERLAAVGQLAAGIAHDFNNIMSVIVLYTDMALGMPDLPPRLHERLQTVSQQARQAASLIQQILDFSRRAVLERHPMDLLPFLKEQVKLLERTLPENIKISLEHGNDEYTVNADPTRIQQAVVNLAVNARDAMPEGGRLFFVLSRTQEEAVIHCAGCGKITGGEWVEIAVKDEGGGIPVEILPHIFEPFFTTKSPSLGTGLGLAQVYGIVKQHEGHIDVSANRAEGTKFVLYFPALTVAQPEVDDMPGTDLIIGQGETILVVEDETPTRDALVDGLELLNYKALAAANGREALAYLEQFGDQIALVLSDVVMPEIGGIALFNAMREKEYFQPVVFLTGHPLVDELEKMRTQGLKAWLLKPPRLEQLARMLALVLGRG
ncbi:MAG TPA: ATP-binding protein [Anaerolineales bacterium]|nr:ATP-binding protein [Anaerolineales bacterium]